MKTISECKTNDCKYRIYPDPYVLQRNALRVEIVGASQRCGKLLKPNRVGGRWDDYFPCLHPIKPNENNNWRGW